MTTTRHVAVLIGSLRKGSFNKKLAEALIKLSPEGLRYESIEIGHLPLYNQDLDSEGDAPAGWTTFREKVKGFDAVLFVTPEYNRSVPGVLKNALDVGSRPYGKSVWNAKPAAVVSSTPGAMGGFGANHHLRQSLVFLNMPTLQQPEAYIGHAANLVSDDGTIANEGTREFLRGFMKAFAAWIEVTIKL
ncbi:NADPH-dependent FMN reductase [Methylocapsa sp. S129]|uniref:NADPH-dependent FMN reductase n=1 Tax=Methylocapsa sp. S129 TaxID=1641869 RepID=UPI00131D1CEC|nr:NAD(P)H-dependent oxidoreductase [Methylocapsa sp. S129]